MEYFLNNVDDIESVGLNWIHYIIVVKRIKTNHAKLLIYRFFKKKYSYGNFRV